MKDYYEILEVSRKASKDTINKVFKIHMKANHPDLFQGDDKIKAEEKSKELTEAYNILSDDIEREKYDAELEQEESLNNNNSQLLQENEYLKQLIAQKDEILARITGDYSQFNGAGQYQQNPYQTQYQGQYQNPYQQQYQNPYQGQYQGYNNFNGYAQQQQDPYAGLSLEELKQLKKEQTKLYYKNMIKDVGIKLIILALIVIVLLISMASSFKDLKELLG